MNSTYKEICDCGAEYLGTDAGTHIKVDNVMCRVCLSCNSVIINKWHPLRAELAAEKERREEAEEKLDKTGTLYIRKCKELATVTKERDELKKYLEEICQEENVVCTCLNRGFNFDCPIHHKKDLEGGE